MNRSPFISDNKLVQIFPVKCDNIRNNISIHHDVQCTLYSLCTRLQQKFNKTKINLAKVFLLCCNDHHHINVEYFLQFNYIWLCVVVTMY